MSEGKHKRCICGGEASTHCVPAYDDTTTTKWEAGCLTCGLHVGRATEQEAIAAWNKRPIHDQLVEAGKRLAEQAKYCYTPDPAARLFGKGADCRSLMKRVDGLKDFVRAFEAALKAAGEEV